MDNEPKSGGGLSREGIIHAVQSPLGFFALALLVVEAIFGVVAGFTSGFDRTIAVGGMVLILALLVVTVAILAWFRPTALQGPKTDAGKDAVGAGHSAGAETAQAPRIASIEWLPDNPSAEQLLSQFRASKVYFVASTIGRTAPEIRQIMRNTTASVELFCPDPNLNLLPPLSVQELQSHLSTLRGFYEADPRLEVWCTANPPSASVAVFVGSDGQPIGAYMSWYTMHYMTNKEPPLGTRQLLSGRGHWGAFVITKSDDSVSNQLLSRAYEYVRQLQGDPTKRKLG